MYGYAYVYKFIKHDYTIGVKKIKSVCIVINVLCFAHG